ncbi:uncharacterized protein PG998_009625 [Apiospora kogelbergensis]|uniref:uncharacterized protein n=1 Tax=Apiospora kogelbergensis TaxID=1337665 RepID=UPI00312D1CE8
MAPHARRQQLTITTAPPTSTTASPKPTAISDCHNHGATVFCMFGTAEYQILGQASATTPPTPGLYGLPQPWSRYVRTPPHCVGAGQSEGAASAVSCGRRDRDYNIPLRIGLLFVVLATSFLGAAVPIFLTPILPGRLGVIFVILKQFGTGVIISTAFVHLFTHASLMFGNECLKDQIKFEGTTAAIVMAGLVVSFFVDYGCHRLAKSLAGGNKTAVSAKLNDDMVSVLILEAGIIFHSILIGLTLVVAGDSFFVTLFIVVLFHQMFEGIALGTRIATLRQHTPSSVTDVSHLPSVEPKTAGSSDGGSHGTPSLEVASSSKPVSLWKKLLMAAIFGITTPIGMAIGIGVLQHFNGKDPSTLVAIGTLDALSAGILLWVGLVEMWARDWIFGGGELVDAGAALTTCASVGLLAGMALMSFLGKWA